MHKRCASYILLRMYSSFHTHTYLCKHADGTPQEYIEQAARDGCSALGFSDHCPYPHDDLWFFCRMSSGELPLYKQLIQEVKAMAPFPVYFGFECEWHPAYRTWFSDVLVGEYGAEYLALGSHWLAMDSDVIYAPDIQEKTLVHRYVDFTIEAMRSGLYAFLAHPDLFLSKRTVIDSDCMAWSNALIDAANDLRIPLEINGYGLLVKSKIVRDYGEDYRYPVRAFWEQAALKNACIICNSDAHEARHVIAGCKRGFEYAQSLGITACDTAKALGFASVS